MKMFKSFTIAMLALTTCVVADPIRLKSFTGRLLAQQQEQPRPASTGYPAAGITPEVPFNLPTETESPNTILTDSEKNQPDGVYRPADSQQSFGVGIKPYEIYGPPESEVQHPDDVYGPPETDIIPDITEEELEEVADVDAADEEVVIDAEDGTVISVSSTFERPARLVYQRFPQSRQPPKSVPARLTVVKPVNFLYATKL